MDTQESLTRLPLSIYLLKAGVDDFSLAIELSAFSERLSVKISDSATADLYISRSQTTPMWLHALSKKSEGEFPNIHASSISGALLVTVEDRGFVLTFGHAWQKIRSRFIEPNFGIRCVLNLAERDSLRAIKRDRIAEDFIQAIEQIPDSDEIDRFGIDIERDLLRGVKAKVDSNREFGSWVAGGDPFKASICLEKESLQSFLARCISLWSLADYQNNFAWVDNIAPIRDELLDAELNQALVCALAEDPTQFVLCTPDLLGWDDFDLFAFQVKKRQHAPCADSLELGMWLDWLSGKGASLNFAALTENYIYAYKDDGSNVRSWTVLSCIHGMLEKNDGHYLVHGGNWFRVDKNFVDRINKRVASIPVSTIDLPLPKIKEKEGDYNLRVANELSGSVLWMDKKLVSHGGGKSRFEVCDLFTDSGHLICVKPWGQASGSLSHLFNQARVSVQLLNNDPIYRQKAKDMIGALDAGFALVWEVICDNPKDAEVVLAVMRCCPKENLPFFAKLSLVNCIDDLLDMRFRATFLALPVDLTGTA